MMDMAYIVDVKDDDNVLLEKLVDKMNFEGRFLGNFNCLAFRGPEEVMDGRFMYPSPSH